MTQQMHAGDSALHLCDAVLLGHRQHVQILTIHHALMHTKCYAFWGAGMDISIPVVSLSSSAGLAPCAETYNIHMDQDSTCMSVDPDDT